jgi:hypothetical protein
VYGVIEKRFDGGLVLDVGSRDCREKKIIIK